MEAETLLAIDVGSANTRALLFVVADGHFNFVAGGQAPTTAGAPHKNTTDGVRQSLENLQRITGRLLLGKEGELIIPTQADGSGVDGVVTSFSAGPTLNIVTIGLLADVSLESAQRLAGSTYARVVESIGLNDRRKPEAQIDAIIQARPDIIVIAGGTDGGAGRSVAHLVEIAGLACYLMPADQRPAVLYAGNTDLAEKMRSQVEPITSVRITANIRPDFDHEDLGPAQACLNEMVQANRAAHVAGIADLISLCDGHASTTAFAFGRVIRFLSQVYDPVKGVMGVDLGARSTVLATATSGKLSLMVQSPLGLGSGITGVLRCIPPAEIAQWLTAPLSEGDLLNYLNQKEAYPNSLPVSAEEQAIDQAIARAILRLAVRGFSNRLHARGVYPGPGLTPPYEPIIASGPVLTQSPSAGQSLLTLLDGLQPVGVTTLVLDQNGLTAALGVAATINPLLPVQVLESGAFINLGTVVSPISEAPFGALILRARLVYADKNEVNLEVKHGSLHMLPLTRGESAQLYLEAVGPTDLGMARPGRGVKVTGGVLGAVIDARGRPLRLPEDETRRQELLKKWQWTLGG
ncbi:MAG: glutamate mutase L [Anaerolineaceae bacterium]|nr:glutamate mutase L [Anaerolineaceae bacterium]